MHIISFPRNVLLLVSLALVTSTALLAHDDKPHQGPTEFAVQNPAEIAAAAVSRIESLVGAKQLDGVHEQTDLLAAALKQIATHADGLGAEQRRRFEAAVKQVLLLADSVHEAADTAQQKKADTETKKLAAAFKLLQAQLGGASVSSPKPAAPLEQPLPTNDDDAVKAVLAAYKRGLEKLDVSQLGQLFSADSQVFESGGVEAPSRIILSIISAPNSQSSRNFRSGTTRRTCGLICRMPLPSKLTSTRSCSRRTIA
jgi:hypothetical protein